MSPSWALGLSVLAMLNRTDWTSAEICSATALQWLMSCDWLVSFLGEEGRGGEGGGRGGERGRGEGRGEGRGGERGGERGEGRGGRRGGGGRKGVKQLV